MHDALDCSLQYIKIDQAAEVAIQHGREAELGKIDIKMHSGWWCQCLGITPNLLMWMFWSSPSWLGILFWPGFVAHFPEPMEWGSNGSGCRQESTGSGSDLQRTHLHCNWRPHCYWYDDYHQLFCCNSHLYEIQLIAEDRACQHRLSKLTWLECATYRLWGLDLSQQRTHIHAKAEREIADHTIDHLLIHWVFS